MFRSSQLFHFVEKNSNSSQCFSLLSVYGDFEYFAVVYDQSSFLSTSGLCFPPPALLPRCPFSLRTVADVALSLGLLDSIGGPVLLCGNEKLRV